jgi:hypothetical protein
MYRRRRTTREIEFSFDSFLDVVANVVGIILRLILVAWVGARTYKASVPVLPPVPALSEPAALPEPTDPRLPRLQQERRLAAARAADAEKHYAGRRDELVRRRREAEQELARLTAEAAAAERTRAETARRVAEGAGRARATELSVGELARRSKALLAELEKLGKEPHATRKLRYRTPVSAPVTKEVTFECHHGKVTVVEVGRMLAQANREAQARVKELQDRWQINDVTAPAGAFRMHFVVERERTMMDGGGPPMPGSYRSGITGWQVEPVAPSYGETLAEAARAGSAFQKVIGSLDPQVEAITFWVYPDSFAVYRQLRDQLHDRGFVVAGRPLDEGLPIAGSIRGSVSRGQ